ncbi:MAG: bifunctional glutamate N-acetyltransferase/amino-acid acetyltransferase ArgJ [Oscillospiraceae bacterium]|nr:bifunctional glutamate N-acetyltransferase/amino-acid acetyltransferase ArgJ [Oscillospiraceae bacterium]
MEFITGGVAAAKGFSASGLHCGIRKNKTKKDLALIVSEKEANAAAMFTTNLVQGAPIAVTRDHLAKGSARAIICNSGNANTCNADGVFIAKEMCRLTAEQLGLKTEDVLVASTGVIGQPLSLDPIANALEALKKGLNSQDGSDAAQAIMTTDTVCKQAAVKFFCGGKECVLGGMAKGSGMIHPDLATMLVFLTTDCAVSSQFLNRALHDAVDNSFHMMSIDQDTSTNDTVCILANGLAGNETICREDEDYHAFLSALSAVTDALCRMIAEDGEGATKLLCVKVSGGKTREDARKIAKTVVCSNLLKCAIFGADANWGRVLCAIGYSKACVSIAGVDVAFSSSAGEIKVCEKGAGIPFSEELAKEILSQKEITISITLSDGEANATAYGCDLTYDYVKINGDYRT